MARQNARMTAPIRRALVTGAAGFIGRHMARALAGRGVEVVGLGHGELAADDRIEWDIQDWHVVDLGRDCIPATMSPPDAVFHCAGGASVAASVESPLQDLQRTVCGTAALLDHMRRKWPETRLVIPSSAGVYGEVAVMPISPSQPLRPASPYGYHKKMAEELCLYYGRHFGIRSAIVRLFSVFGTGLRKQLLWDACSKLMAGNSNFSGSGSETRDWIHVDDAVALLMTAATHAAVDPPIVNAGAGEATRIVDVVGLLARRLGVSVVPTFNGEARAGDPLHYRADITTALAWGWRPERNQTLEMERYADWFRKSSAS